MIERPGTDTRHPDRHAPDLQRLMILLPGPANEPAPGAWWQRLHADFMPDYNRKTTAYWCAAVLLGSAILVHALLGVTAMPLASQLQIAVGAAIAMLAGLVPIRIPRSKSSLAAGDIFIFLLLLLHGPAAATLAAAAEGLVGSWRTSRRWTSRIASPAMASIAMFALGSLLQAAIAAGKANSIYGPSLLLTATMLSAVLYFVLNTLLITAVPHLKRNQWPALATLFGDFSWVGITCAGSASVSCLLFLAFEQAGLGVLIAAAPIIAMLVATLHYFFGQQEAAELARHHQMEAIGREAELSARHVLALQKSERRFHSAFTHASIGMALVEFDGRVLQVNDALRELIGETHEAGLVGQAFDDIVDAADMPRLAEGMRRLDGHGVDDFSVELRLRRRDGREVWAAVHCSHFSDSDSTAPCLILQVQDVSARRQAEVDLHYIAFHDSLTGLPNRRRFHEQLAQALERSQHTANRHFGLMFLDFDRFKLINDSLGHAVGDEFLIHMARRIQDHLRPNDVVARLGGDEFAILADDLEGERYVLMLADRLLEVLRQPFHIGGNEITTSASIGITFSGMGYATPADMLRDADTAMYKAKLGGKARYALFDAGLHFEVSHRMRLEGDLRRTLAAGALSLEYQPLYDLVSGEFTGFEALARWNHPELGSISPVTFIPVAEDAALMVPLTDFMLRSACRQLRLWQQRDPSLATLGMHVNVSGHDIAQPNFVARINAAVAGAGIAPVYLTLELTENILLTRLEAARPALVELRRQGVNLSIDDFGNGYSSLRHLSSLPVNSLKIDRAFVADLQRGGSEDAIVRAIILLGNSLGKSIIAEGIENPVQVELLRQLGCLSGQGYHLSRPLPAAGIDELLTQRLARLHAEQAPSAAGALPGPSTEARPALVH